MKSRMKICWSVRTYMKIKNTDKFVHASDFAWRLCKCPCHRKAGRCGFDACCEHAGKVVVEKIVLVLRSDNLDETKKTH